VSLLASLLQLSLQRGDKPSIAHFCRCLSGRESERKRRKRWGKEAGKEKLERLHHSSAHRGKRAKRSRSVVEWRKIGRRDPP
jgi:hypothetical protein